MKNMYAYLLFLDAEIKPMVMHENAGQQTFRMAKLLEPYPINRLIACTDVSCDICFEIWKFKGTEYALF